MRILSDESVKIEIFESVHVRRTASRTECPRASSKSIPMVSFSVESSSLSPSLSSFLSFDDKNRYLSPVGVFSKSKCRRSQILLSFGQDFNASLSAVSNAVTAGDETTTDDRSRISSTKSKGPEGVRRASGSFSLPSCRRLLSSEPMREFYHIRLG